MSRKYLQTIKYFYNETLILGVFSYVRKNIYDAKHIFLLGFYSGQGRGTASKYITFLIYFQTLTKLLTIQLEHKNC